VSDIETPDSPETSATSEFSEFFHTDELPDSPSRVRQPAGVEISPFMARLLAPVTAVVVVIVVVVLLIWINGGSSGHKQDASALQTKAGRSVVAATSPKHHRSSSHAEASSTTAHAGQAKHAAHSAHSAHSGRAGPATSPSTTASVAARHRTEHLATSKSTTATAPVTVLNNSRRTGLAHAAATQIHSKGWKIHTVGNLQGLTPESTVYYAPGHAAAAKHLAHDFSSVQRVEPNHAGHIHGSALTLVVTAAWRL
jgi:hypothetical protein